MITGIDISEKNGKVHLKDLADGEVKFVYIKASEALDSIDRCYQQNLFEACECGLSVGAYHWLHPRLHVEQQAQLFINTVKNFSGMLPPMVCLQQHRAPIDEIEKNVKTFLRLLEDAVNAKPVIYTNANYWKKYLSHAKWACEYPLWMDYPGSNWPPQIYPWAGWTFWQYSYQSRLPGIPAMLGLNWFNGSVSDLKIMVIK